MLTGRDSFLQPKGRWYSAALTSGKNVMDLLTKLLAEIT